MAKSIEELRAILEANGKTVTEIEEITNRIARKQQEREKFRESNRSERAMIRALLNKYSIKDDDIRRYHFDNDNITAVVIRVNPETVHVVFSFKNKSDVDIDARRRSGFLSALVNYSFGAYVYAYSRLPNWVDSSYYALHAFKHHQDDFPSEYEKGYRVMYDITKEY